MLIRKLKRAVSLLLQGNFDVLLYRAGLLFGKRIILPRYPGTLNIEPTNACNLRCPTCPTGSGALQRPKRMMKYADYCKIIDEVKGHVYYIGLFFMGEPFLNGDLLKMIRYTADAGIDCEISTNGHFFNSREQCKNIVESGLKHCVVSLDGADRETLATYRINADFDSIIDGIRTLQEIKKECNSVTPTIELQYIVMRHNEHQRDAMKDIAASLEVDYFCEKTMGSMSNDIESDEQQELCRKYLPEDLVKSRYYLGNDGKYHLKGQITNDCSWVYESAVITVDGDVVPCCYDTDADYTMGNIFEEPLAVIWKNVKYRSFRERIESDRKSIPLCNVCSEGRCEILEKNLLKTK